MLSQKIGCFAPPFQFLHESRNDYDLKFQKLNLRFKG